MCPNPVSEIIKSYINFIPLFSHPENIFWSTSLQVSFKIKYVSPLGIHEMIPSLHEKVVVSRWNYSSLLLKYFLNLSRKSKSIRWRYHSQGNCGYVYPVLWYQPDQYYYSLQTRHRLSFFLQYHPTISRPCYVLFFFKRFIFFPKIYLHYYPYNINFLYNEFEIVTSLISIRRISENKLLLVFSAC